MPHAVTTLGAAPRASRTAPTGSAAVAPTRRSADLNWARNRKVRQAWFCLFVVCLYPWSAHAGACSGGACSGGAEGSNGKREPHVTSCAVGWQLRPAAARVQRRYCGGCALALDQVRRACLAGCRAPYTSAGGTRTVVAAHSVGAIACFRESCRRTISGYAPPIDVADFHASWRTGKARGHRRVPESPEYRWPRQTARILWVCGRVLVEHRPPALPGG